MADTKPITALKGQEDLNHFHTSETRGSHVGTDQISESFRGSNKETAASPVHNLSEYVPRADYDAALKIAAESGFCLSVLDADPEKTLNALEEVVYLYSNAAHVLEIIGCKLLEGGDYPSLHALCDLCATTYRHKADTAGGELEILGQWLRAEKLNTASKMGG